MNSLFGRDAELAKGRGVLESAARAKVVRALRVVGASGVGKTALAEVLAADAASANWLAVWAPGFRIHAGLPLFAARRIVQGLLEALGGRADRYASGLTLNREQPEDFEEAFLRIVEGVTLDHRLLLVLDDAQWADAESLALIERTVTTLADRAIVVLTTQRSDETTPGFGLVDQTVVLDNLSLEAAIEIVRSIYPGVNDDVATGIASETRGRAADVVAVATAARDNRATTLRDVSANTRRVVARDLATLDARVREFLQICAVIDEPIDLRLLQQLWGQDELFALIAQVSGRYITATTDSLQFVHSTVLESVLETIPIAIPLRHRVIEALKRLPEPRLEDYERLAKQCAATGDRDGERDALNKLSGEAAKHAQLSLSAAALERALAISSPQRSDIVPTYARLSQLYNGLGREPEAIRVCRRALAEAEAAGVTDGLGAIAASIVLAQWHSGLIDEARATIARYQNLSGNADRANLFSLGEYVAMHSLDVDAGSIAHDGYERYEDFAEPPVAVRHAVTHAFLALRMGDEQIALEYIKRAEELCENGLPYLSIMPLAARVYHALGYRGPASTDHLIAQMRERSKWSPVLVIQGHALIARGELPDADEFISDNMQSLSNSMQRLLISARLSAWAFRGIEPSVQAWDQANHELSSFEAGETAPQLLPTVLAALPTLASRSPERARRILHQAIATAAIPSDVTLVMYPVFLSIAARTLEEKVASEQIASGRIWADKQPWNQAHHFLARGVAAAALGMSDQRVFLEEARERFTTLGATHFAQMASEYLGKTSASADNGKQLQNTTRREREVAALVAEGKTNREIAERLVLSERTVEGHIANLFAKVNVNSRTQLATWFMRMTSSVASAR